MPRVPTLEEPQSALEPMPVVQGPFPPVGAFGEQIGQALAENAQEAKRIAIEGMHAAARTQVTEAESAYIGISSEIRNKYVEKKGFDAMEGYRRTTLALDKSLKTIKDKLGSREAQNEFASSALRQQIREQSIVETHYASERNAHEKGVFNNYMLEGSKSLSSLAGSGHAPIETVEHQWADMFVHAHARAVDLGYHGAEADEFAKHAMGPATQALLKTLGDTGSPLLKQAIEKWGPLVSETSLQGAQNAYGKQYVQAAVRDIFKDVPRIDASGKKNEEGALDEGRALKNLRKYQDDPHFEDIERSFNRRFDFDRKQQDADTKQLADKIRKAAQADPATGKPDGKFDISRASEDYKARLNARAPTKLTDLQKLDDHFQAKEERKTRREELEERRQTKVNVGLYLTLMGPDEVSKYTKFDLNEELDKHPELEDADRLHLARVLEERQALAKKPDAFEHRALEIVKSEATMREPTDKNARVKLTAELQDFTSAGLREGWLARDPTEFRKKLHEHILGIPVNRGVMQHDAPAAVRPPPAPVRGVEWERGPDGVPRPKAVP